MEFSQKITDLFSSLFGKSEFSDIEILLKDGSEIPGHKMILYIRNNSWRLDDFITADNLDLSMYPVDTVMLVLKWVYTDEIDMTGISTESLQQLLSVAKNYNLQSLYTRCAAILNHTQDVEKYEIINLDNTDVNVMKKSRDVEVNLEDSRTSVADITVNKSVVTIETDIAMDAAVKSLGVAMDTVVNSDDDVEYNSDLDEILSQNEESDEDFEVNNILVNSSGSQRRPATGKHQCLVCGKCFENRGHFTNHVIIHTGVKSFSCEVCGKSFNRKSSLVRHTNIHTKERSFFCELCEKSFLDSSSLQKHKKIHFNIKDHECEICSRKFCDSSNFKRHVKSHGVKKYPCPECHRKFRDGYTLQRHSLTHEKVKNFSCHLCTSSFRWLPQLEKHILSCEKIQK